MDFIFTIFLVLGSIVILSIALKLVINTIKQTVQKAKQKPKRDTKDTGFFLVIILIITSLLVYALPTLFALIAVMILLGIYLLQHLKLRKTDK